MTDTDSTDNSAAPGSQVDQASLPRFEALSIYIKDVSFEAPSLPRVFLEKSSQPATNRVDFRVEHSPISEQEGLVEVLLRVTVTSSLESETLYLAEVVQGGLFVIRHNDPAALEKALDVTCPTILLPFAREQISNLITKGCFPPFLIAPINFEHAYQEKLKQRAEQQNGSDNESRA
ncbi:MAG: protein-export chaperone SecB [Gammaproteobacteria bacterium]|nr:protein-export chaperone SecB [Gammaproteobacteria bacterium]MYD76234.1 protein-export chaperone SecB [Gammaproteobacteria bacterium]MYJ51851.1 protein-export chaperone SecB [Gammaproteobacteria bacterium]